MGVDTLHNMSIDNPTIRGVSWGM